MTDSVVVVPIPDELPESAPAGVPAARSGRHEAICSAAFELLGEVGYDRMSMDAVAARARASKATIYRAWPTKPDLVMESVIHRFGPTPEPPDTGTLRGDLMAIMEVACQVANSPDGAVLMGLMSAAARDPELSRTLFRCVYETKHVMYESMIDRAMRRGEVPQGTDPKLLHEVMHAMVLTHKLWSPGTLDQRFVVRVVDDVLMPVLRHPSGADSDGEHPTA